MKHHRLALGAFFLSWLLAGTGGLLFAWNEHVSAALGLYWAIGVVTTAGGDLVPHTTAGYWIAGLTKLLAVPMWSMAFTLAVSWFTSRHVTRATEDLKAHISEQVSSGTP